MSAILRSPRRAMRAALLMATALSASALTPDRASADCVSTGGPNEVLCSGATDYLDIPNSAGPISVTMSGGVTIGDVSLRGYSVAPSGGYFSVTYTELGPVSGQRLFVSTKDLNDISITTAAGSQFSGMNIGVYADVTGGSGDVRIVNRAVISDGLFAESEIGDVHIDNSGIFENGNGIFWAVAGKDLDIVSSGESRNVISGGGGNSR